MTLEQKEQAVALLDKLHYWASFGVADDGIIRGYWGHGSETGYLIVTLTDKEVMAYIYEEHKRLAEEADARMNIMIEIMTDTLIEEHSEELPERDVEYMRRLLDSKEKQIKAHHDQWQAKKELKTKCGECLQKRICSTRAKSLKYIKEKWDEANLEHTKESEASATEYAKKGKEVDSS